MTNDSQLEELRATATAVAQEKAAMDDKRDELLTETGRVLDLVVAAVRPALPALVQRLPSSGLKRTGPGGEGAVEEHSFLQLEGVDVRGVHVAGNGTPVEDLPKAQSGKLRGRGLWLLEDGRFVSLSYAGTWSKQAELARSWTATATVLAPAEVGAAFKLAHIMEHLSKALVAHRRPDGVKRLELDLAKVRAVAQVLAGLSNLLG